MIRPDFREYQSNNDIIHFGIPRRIGRYPFGSGDRPFQSLKNQNCLQKKKQKKKKEEKKSGKN